MALRILAAAVASVHSIAVLREVRPLLVESYATEAIRRTVLALYRSSEGLTSLDSAAVHAAQPPNRSSGEALATSSS
jgi:hypothetical protein